MLRSIGKLIVVLFILFAIFGGASDCVFAAPILQVPEGWQEVGNESATGGGISNNATDSTWPSIAATSKGEIYVAWRDGVLGNSASYEIYVKRWNGSTWEEVFGSASGGGISNYGAASRAPYVTVGPNDEVYVTWTEWFNPSTGFGDIFVKQLTEEGWLPLGGSLNPSGGGVSSSSYHSNSDSGILAAAPDGTIYVVYSEDDRSPEIYVKKYNRATDTWEPVSPGSANDPGISNTPSYYSYSPSITVGPDGTPYVSWHDGGRSHWDHDVFVKRFDRENVQWEAMGPDPAPSGAIGISPPIDNSRFGRMEVTSDGEPLIVWADRQSGNSEIFVKRWIESDQLWQEYSTGSAIAGGISNTPGDSDNPWIQLSSTDIPHVVWEEKISEGAYRAYIRRWNGDDWEEMGAGSATGGGISNTSGKSRLAKMAIGPDDTVYVVWQDDSSGDNEIYIRQYNTDIDVDAGGPYSGDEGSAVQLNATSEGSNLLYSWTVDSSLCAFSNPNILNPTITCGDNGTYSVTLNVSAGPNAQGSDSATVTIANVPPTIEDIGTPTAPVNINDQSSVNVAVAFSDPGWADTHDVTWVWGDESSDTQADAASPASQSHTYGTPGVYVLTATVVDDDEGMDTQSYQYIVIYDPDGGFVTGGGWIISPADAYTADPALTGKATFGFVSKYKKGTNIPTGNTQFQFKAGDLNFHSDSYDWLVVAGQDKAKFKGVGTINGGGNYGFMLTAVDGNPDTFRIKIWDKDAGDAVVYDNKMGVDNDSHDGTELGGGNIKVHKK